MACLAEEAGNELDAVYAYSLLMHTSPERSVNRRRIFIPALLLVFVEAFCR